MNNLKIQTFTAPSDWASYLINGDESSITPQDLTACNLWLDWVGLGMPVGVVLDVDFGRSFDGDCIAYTQCQMRAQDIAEYAFLAKP